MAALSMLGLVVVGCATGPRYSEIADRIPPIREEMGRVFFYRPAAMTAGALRPDVILNDRAVGKAEPHGFFFVDTTPGQYTVRTSVIIEHQRSFKLDAGKSQYVRMTSTVGVMAGHIIPSIVDESRALREMQGLAFTGSEDLLTQ